MPRALALEMLLTGDPVDAEKAAAIGLVNRVVDDGGALDAAVELATGIAVERPAGRRRHEADRARGARRGRRTRPGTASRRSSGPVFTSEDAREGAAAFAEKRAPVWKGR